MHDLWVITSYFNPHQYERRKLNYRVFRDRLKAPLCAIELAFDGNFFLGPDDADMLIKVRDGDVLWQKERLLNVALSRLPTTCKVVAWVDCDMVFADSDWPTQAANMLAHHHMVQLFTHAHHTPADGSATAAPDALPALDPARSTYVMESFASLHERGALPLTELPAGRRIAYTPGHAWAMRRQALESVGLYDAAIIGGGTLLMAASAVGGFDEIIQRFQMNQKQAAHYLAWARRFHSVVDNRVAALPGIAYHLWHGDEANRGYGVRFATLAKAGFDPTTDLRLGPHGAWKWASDKPGLHAALKQYFVDRREDETPALP